MTGDKLVLGAVASLLAVGLLAGRSPTKTSIPRQPGTLLGQRLIYRSPGRMDAASRGFISKPTPGWLDLDYQIPDPPGKQEALDELDYLTSIIPERSRMGSFVQAADEDIVGVFLNRCDDLGVSCSRQKLSEIVREAGIVITKMKWRFNRPRPFQVAAANGIDFVPMDSVTADSPAYPSGHTIQSYLMASWLGKRHPEHLD